MDERSGVLVPSVSTLIVERCPRTVGGIGGLAAGVVACGTSPVETKRLADLGGRGGDGSASAVADVEGLEFAFGATRVEP